MPKLRFGRLTGPKTVIVTAVMLALMVGTAWAARRPIPLMDYAPQETGIYDTYYDYLMEDDCRYCHGSSVADRHHFSEAGQQGQCTTCHIVLPPPDYGVTIYRDCRYVDASVKCHFDFDNGWHHNTYLADSDQCTACHNPQILGTLGPFQDPTLQPPTVCVTPTPYNCDNCHYEQLAQTVNGYVHPSTDKHYDPWGQLVANLDQKPAAGFTTGGGELPMSPNDDGWWYSTDELGAARTGGWEKDILINDDTHHMNFLGTVSAKCTNCHANDPGDPSWDPNDPILIRYCERCHDISSLHRIAGHVDSVEIWNSFMFGNNMKAWEAAEIAPTADAQIYRTFITTERCVGCHANCITTYDPPYDCQEAPVIATILPNAGEPGAVVVITGSGFGEDVNEVDLIGKSVIEMSGPGTGGVWVSLPVISWTNIEVSFRLPAWVFPVGNYSVRVSAIVITNPPGPPDVCDTLALVASNQVGFTVTDHPTLTDIDTSVDPLNFNGDAYSYGPFYSDVYLKGTGGFGANSTASLGIDLRDAVYVWNADGPNKYYVTRAALGNPNLAKPKQVNFTGPGNKETTFAGLDTHRDWWWGDNDGLGFETVYVYVTSVEPITADYMGRVFSQVILTASDSYGGGTTDPFCPQCGSLVVADSSQTWNSGTNDSITSWNDTNIRFQLLWLWRDNNGDYLQNAGEAPYVAPDFVHVGDYDVRVRSIYWVDKNANNVPDQPNPGDPDNPANEFTQVCVSDPVNLNLTNDPQIWKVKPARVTKGSTVSLIGANFGTEINDSIVTIYKDAAGTIPAFLPNGQIAAGSAKLRLWSNTKIKIKTTGMTKGAKYVKVTVGGISSSLRKFRLI